MKEKIKLIKNKIEEVRFKIDNAYNVEGLSFIGVQKLLEELNKEHRELRKQLEILERKYFVIHKWPTLRGDTLDLYLRIYDKETLKSKFIITKHKTKEYVGVIDYEGNRDSIFGNVSYFANKS